LLDLRRSTIIRQSEGQGRPEEQPYRRSTSARLLTLLGVEFVVTQVANQAGVSLGDVDLRVRRAYHELRAPTALIATVVRNALEQQDISSARSALELIERIAERTLNRVSTVLESPGTEARRSPAVFLRDLSRDTVNCGVALQLHIDGAAEGAAVLHDPAAFEALAQSLVENAQQHGEQGVPIEVALERLDGDTLLLAVRNAPATADHHRGRHMGLPLARELASRMHGDLHIDARPEAFTVRLTVPVHSS
jgi:signal transduction histidine kinase